MDAPEAPYQFTGTKWLVSLLWGEPASFTDGLGGLQPPLWVSPKLFIAPNYTSERLPVYPKYLLGDQKLLLLE